jgi:predicted nucleic acid-binding protein
MADAPIAAICRSHGVPIATCNVLDFEFSGVEVINPRDV